MKPGDGAEDFAVQLREALPDSRKPKRTICEVHREMYDRLEELGLLDDPLIPMLEDAYALGKKIDAKLRQHKLRKGDDWYANERTAVMNETLARRRTVRIERQAARIEKDRLARLERKKAPTETPTDEREI